MSRTRDTASALPAVDHSALGLLLAAAGGLVALLLGSEASGAACVAAAPGVVLAAVIQLGWSRSAWLRSRPWLAGRARQERTILGATLLAALVVVAGTEGLERAAALCVGLAALAWAIAGGRDACSSSARRRHTRPSSGSTREARRRASPDDSAGPMKKDA